MTLDLRPSTSCAWDLVALGEVMLRLDPGEGRVHTARAFRVWEGGGEYNVARALRRCFGLRTSVVTSLADNAVGRLIEDLMLQGGVDLSHVRWVPYDGIGSSVRNGLNFTERGFGVRGGAGCSDRGHTAASQMLPADVDWNALFAEEGVRWFHTGGVFAALSASTRETLMEALRVAREHGTVVSYDLNYRASLWEAQGGREAAQRANREVMPFVDVIVGNEEDYLAALGFEVHGSDDNLLTLDSEAYLDMLRRVAAAYPGLRFLAATLRSAKTATRNDWAAVGWADGEPYRSKRFDALEIMDRVGGGDSFASGLVYGLMTGSRPARALDLGIAHGALAMTTPGDVSMASLAEVERLAAGGGSRMIR